MARPIASAVAAALAALAVLGVVGCSAWPGGSDGDATVSVPDFTTTTPSTTSTTRPGATTVLTPTIPLDTPSTLSLQACAALADLRSVVEVDGSALAQTQAAHPDAVERYRAALTRIETNAATIATVLPPSLAGDARGVGAFLSAKLDPIAATPGDAGLIAALKGIDLTPIRDSPQLGRLFGWAANHCPDWSTKGP